MNRWPGKPRGDYRVALQHCPDALDRLRSPHGTRSFLCHSGEGHRITGVRAAQACCVFSDSPFAA
ncbi:hypothetical protein [Rhizobium sp. Nf11,1]|uniref:hypothetical protein n=1 Tax=Rhizobium sp. Nf11,1 TaxID=3404923 RepID=UPI003D32D438